MSRTRGHRPALALALAGIMTLTGCNALADADALLGGGGQGGNDESFVVDDGSGDGTESSGAANGEGPGGGGSSAAPAAGTIAVKVENPPAAERTFRFEASECLVSDPRIRGVGSGTQTGTGTPASILIDTVPGTLEHERTGTWQASGAITLTAGDEVIVADGRMITVGDYPQESVLMSRISGNSVKYVVAWFFADGTSGAGAVEMTCD